MTGPAVRLLGAVGIDGGEAPLPLGPCRQRSVLAVLLLSLDRPVRAGDLIGRVWGDEPPPAADQALRSYLCRLRGILDQTTTVRLRRRDGGYAVAVEDGELDLAVFRQLVSRARVAVRDGRHTEALADLEQALTMSDGPLLAGVASDWLDEQRGLLQRERLAVALERNDLALATGAPELVVTDAIARMTEEPYDERVAGQAVLALAGVGRTAEALDVYEGVRRRLADELGIDPGPTLRDVQQRVLRGVDSLDSSAARAAPAAAAADPVPRQLPPAVRGFVDRTTEARALDRLLLRGGDESAVVVLGGPGGSGKTALAVNWARRHAGHFPDGQLFVDLHGFDPSRRPTTPESALRALLGALGLAQDAIPADLAGMVGAYRSLLAHRRVLLVADDVAGADQVAPLLPPGPGSAAVLTSRSGLPGLVTTAGAAVLPVGLFDQAAARELLVERLGVAQTAAEPVAVARLVEHCGGLPLALAIVAGRAAALPGLPLATLADELTDESRRLAALSGTEARSDLDATVACSMATLSSAGCSVLQQLAAGPAIGIRSSRVAALAGFTEREADDLLRELLGIHLLEPAGRGQFRMHDLVRLVVRSRPAPAADLAIERLLSFLISERADLATDLDDLLVAHAYAAETGRQTAVCDLADVLEAPLGSAGRWCDLVLVSDRAVAAARRFGDDHRQAAALVGRGRGRIGLREFDGAGQDLAAALTLAVQVGDLGLRARAHRALARLGAHQHRWDEALLHDRCGLALQLRRGDVVGQAHAHNAIGWHLAHLGRAQESLASCRRALAIFVERDDRGGQALTLDSIGYALHRLDRVAEARDSYRSAATMSRELGWQVVLANTLIRSAETAEQLGDHAGAAAAQAEARSILQLAGSQVLEP